MKPEELKLKETKMTEIEIKKALYKQKPKAVRIDISDYDNTHRYRTELNNGTYVVFFDIPEQDMIEAKFKDEMEAQLLIRWISFSINKANLNSAQS